MLADHKSELMKMFENYSNLKKKKNLVGELEFFVHFYQSIVMILSPFISHFSSYRRFQVCRFFTLSSRTNIAKNCSK